MELASIEASEHHLPEGYTTVGYAVDGLRHLAPTPIGRRVRIRSVLTEVDRNRLAYSVEAFEGDKKIGVASHKRAIISTEGEAEESATAYARLMSIGSRISKALSKSLTGSAAPWFDKLLKLFQRA